MKIVVCDDEPDMALEWVASINDLKLDGAAIVSMEQPEQEVARLVERKIAVKAGGNPDTIPSVFDGIDVLVIDYDLVLLNHDGSRTTGEGIARLARTYSRCGAIIVMNQFKGPQFDLGMRGHIESFADVNIDAELVDRKSLWMMSEAVVGEFHPTTWTPTSELLQSVRGFVAKLTDVGLDAAAMPLLGLEGEALVNLSDSAYGFISLTAETSDELAAVTIRDFLNRSLDDEIVTSLEKTNVELLVSFAGFRLAKWLDRAVLRPMDVLIDTAHLIDRFPFLLADYGPDPNIWNVGVTNPQEKLKWAAIKDFYNDVASSVLGRAVFDWYRMDADDTLAEMQDQYIEAGADRLHLAEDTSCFVPNSSLTRFRADFHNFGDRRAIEKLDTISYGPLRRLKFG